MTLIEVEDGFCDFVKNNYSNKTYITYKSYLHIYVIELFGEKDVNDLKLENYIETIRFRKTHKHTKNSIYGFSCFLRLLSRYLFENGLVEEDVLKNDGFTTSIVDISY